MGLGLPRCPCAPRAARRGRTAPRADAHTRDRRSQYHMVWHPVHFDMRPTRDLRRNVQCHHGYCILSAAWTSRAQLRPCDLSLTPSPTYSLDCAPWRSVGLGTLSAVQCIDTVDGRFLPHSAHGQRQRLSEGQGHQPAQSQLHSPHCAHRPAGTQPEPHSYTLTHGPQPRSRGAQAPKGCRKAARILLLTSVFYILDSSLLR